jgi:hypothetical protein
MPKGRAEVDTDPELLEMELPRRRVRIGNATRSLMEMDACNDKPLYFKLPVGTTMETWSARIGSWISCARKHKKGYAYAKRMVEFDGEEGVAVWRTK